MSRPANWKYLAPHPPANTLTFSEQPRLPRLPVPPLAATIAKLKDSLKPLAKSDEEYNAALKKIDDFAAGQAPVLHQRLLDRREENTREHWLEEWWDDAAYMNYRDSVVVNVSYYYGFTPHPTHLPQNPTSRAASLTRSALLFRRQLKRGLIPPDATKDGALCMDTWRWMFDCSRVPGVNPADWSVSYAKEGDLGDGGHIIVLRRGRVWKVDVSNGGQLLSTDELSKQFQYIYDQTNREYPPVGVLTVSNRDIWAKDYDLLIQDPHNARIVREIHSSAFIVCLDTEQPGDAVEFSRACWHGGIKGEMLGNRWVDKPCQFIVFDNNQAGFMGEHSVMDGTPTTRMCDEVVEALHSKTFDHGSPTGKTLALPEALDWKISKPIDEAVNKALAAAADLVGSQDLGYHLTSYGKAAIKKYGFSPDSWSQMIIQLAYHRLTGGQLNGGTYEAATTRKFHKGRTEAIRIVTSESRAWTKSMDDGSVNDVEKRTLFRAAAKKHISDARDAGRANGIDRHLLGLKKLVRNGEETPALFSDELFTRSSYWVLSTSAIWSKHFPVYGWGEVVPDGFGVAYMTGYDDRLQFTVTSRKEMPNAKFVQELAKAAVDLQKLFESEKSVKAKL